MAEDEQQQQQTYPFTNIQVTPQGVLLTFHLTPGLSNVVALNEATVNDIMKLWLQTRQEIARAIPDLALINHIKQTKKG